MADAILGTLMSNLSSLIQTEFVLLHGVKDEVEKLSFKLSTVRAVIEDAETRQQADTAIAVWLTRLKDIAYDAEDVLDEWLTQVQPSELESTQVSQSCTSWFPFIHPFFHHKIAKKIKKFHADFDYIAGEITKFDLKPRVVQEMGARLDPNRETSSSLVEPNQIYGRDEDQRKIVDMLISNANSPNDVSVLPLVGVGGLGKTTLAQLVYNDERVSKYFEKRMWVCVAEDFDVKRITTLIIESLSGKTCDLKGLDPLQNHLKELLSGKRFLLVLDDVWNDNPDTWGKLKQPLTCGTKGSSILITTRLDPVASIMGTLPMYNLSFLSDDKCWALFKACACCDGDLSADLEEIGKQIVKKSGGIPLAAKVLGALLRFRRNVHEWESIRVSEIWELPEEKKSAILGVLRLSYNHLPSELKQCFSYCSLYPKDHDLMKTELIQIWMANGYVRSIGKMELEDIGNYIFNELLRGSFFQDPVKDYSGNIVKCKMHDLMHDLACSITKTDCCVVDVEKIENVPKSVRHLSLTASSSKPLSNPYKSLCKSNKFLRTHFLYFLYSPLDPPPLQMIFSKLKYIRVLNLSSTDCLEVPNSVGGMKCLRYLNLSNNSIEFLPDSICSLINLQTLNLNGCSDLKRLPKHMRKMKNLRHLDVGGCWCLRKMPIKMGKMIGLRTMSKFVVGKGKGEQISELNGLKHLTGELELSRLKRVKDPTEAKEADLASKTNLSSVSLSWGSGYVGGLEEMKKKSESVVECLQPHVNLNQKLKITIYPGVVLPSWMSLLRNLREIELRFCDNCKTLPPLGQLPRLEVLKIWGMNSLKCIGVEFYGEIVGEHLKVFPSLEELQLEYMPNLEKWEFPQPSLLLNDDDDENGSAIFPCLRKLRLWNCRKLLETPSIFMETSSSCCLRNLNSLSIGGVSFPIPSLRNYTALETLEIYQNDNIESILSGEIENLTALKSLEICRCDSLKSIPDEIGNLTALKSLVISWCSDLISLPAEGLQKLTSLNLNSFTIQSCYSLKSLPAMGRMIQEGMTMKSSCCSLVFLEIRSCSSLTSVSEGLRYLSSLETLEIYNCDELELKWEDFQHLTSLRHLTLRSLLKLISVPDVQNLTALQSLKLLWDYNLRILPEGVQQHLTSLQTLQVHDCHPDLHKRLEKNKGVDWPNISHIPHVDIRR